MCFSFLQTLNLFILGPPLSGKTKLAHKLAKRYDLVYLNPKNVIQTHIERIVRFYYSTVRVRILM